jgi:hypothetical protein
MNSPDQPLSEGDKVNQIQLKSGFPDKSYLGRMVPASPGEPERHILGDNEVAGQPISAPVGNATPMIGNLRWIKREHSYSLQQCIITDIDIGPSWEDVPLVLDR